MKTLYSFLFWTVAALAVIPAIVGVTVAFASIIAIALVAVILVLVASAVACLCCLPIVWWCATWDGIQTQHLLNKFQKSISSNS